MGEKSWVRRSEETIAGQGFSCLISDLNCFVLFLFLRGSFSLEVVTAFLALKLAEPEGIFLTRGNHESKNMNKIYGFEGEVSPAF